jgi:dTDP-4-amino-4,6-dideoxy-D-galactose acyltransferase
MIEELEWDTGFFGRKIGRLINVPGDEDLLKDEIAEAARQKFVYLTCRLGVHEIPVVQMLERQGFYLTDVGIVWERGIEGVQEPQISVREGTAADGAWVRKIAAGLFKGGRFYLDPFFTHEEADRLYQAWAENSLKGQADKVFLVDGKGFITCRISDNAGDIPLVGVSEGSRAKGVGTALVLGALKWFKAQGVETLTVRTQADNAKAIRFYQKLAFKLKSVDITMGNIVC